MKLSKALQKVIAGDSYRKTRLHDEKGNFVGLQQFCHLPQNLVYFTGRILFHRYPNRPWFTFNAHQRIERILERDWIMVEFGSGMSTLWFAPRVASIQSIEHDPKWYELVQARLEAKGLKGVRYELRVLQAYTDLSDHKDRSVDFAVVDGVLRSECVRALLPKLKPGGYVYLDNSDKDMTAPGGDVRRAEELLLAASQTGGHVEYFTGFTIGSINTHQGMLVRLPVSRTTV